MESKVSKSEDNQWWQWIIIIGLVIAIIISLYFYFLPKKDYRKVYDPKMLSIQEEIEGYKRQLGTSKNYLAYNLLAGAYIKQARLTGDPSWYILAEQNALSSLANAPISNYSALFILASTNMAKHEFAEAKKLASQMTDDPNMKLQALGIIFDANYAIGDLKACEKNLAEIEQSKKEIFKYKLPGVDPKDVNDMINTNRYALLSYSQGKVKESEKYFLKAIRESVNIAGEPKAWIYNLYATFLTKNGRLVDAKHNIQYALNEVPDYTSALVQKSEIAYQEKNWQEIINNLKPVNDKIPRSDIILRLAKAEKKLNNLESYNKLMNQAESLLKEEVSVGGFGHRRDYIQLLIEKNTPESLKEALAKAESEKKLRADLDTLLIIADAEIKNQQLDLAKTTLAKANTGVKDSNLYYLQGQLAEYSGNKNQAIKYYKNAIALNPIFNHEATEHINSFNMDK